MLTFFFILFCIYMTIEKNRQMNSLSEVNAFGRLQPLP